MIKKYVPDASQRRNGVIGGFGHLPADQTPVSAAGDDFMKVVVKRYGGNSRSLLNLRFHSVNQVGLIDC